MIVIADTSGLLAALDSTHPEGARAREAIDQAGALVVSPVLLAEFDHLAVRLFGRKAALTAFDDICRWIRAGRALSPDITIEILDAARTVRSTYTKLDLDVADAVNVALAQAYRTNVILTLDRRDFRTIRPLSAYPAFRLLPDDL